MYLIGARGGPFFSRLQNPRDEKAHPADNGGMNNNAENESALQGYLTTIEAALYMRKSRGWILNRKDIPYYRGKPNLYKKEDLDDWLNRNRRHEPKCLRGE